ncbi:YceI family protein [Runella slithyformis]|uniref:YceI family protein n=1 Tax=Runella slithyformis (strain ATCC 29530 / DSM 19594 / LMG 11500 / NCIMB 11436 / LSU 4) TaxID=761193 RepID=A0A7U4E5M1_RUNSL|nr:YceI family protein [Runella slithyformis]AEI48716.1 YceI family protein [Runella slithyformis DSM 19594]
MKKITLAAAVLLVSFAGFAQTWKVDKAHAKLGFTVTHLLMSEVDGNFKSFDATITSSKEDFSDAVVELTAEVASANTDNEMRDAHLKRADMFDAEKHPTLTFKSTSISKVADKKYKLNGNLTIKGVTKPVSLDMTLTGMGKDGRTQKPKAGIKVTGTIKRTDFGVGGMPSGVVSEEVELRALGEFNQQ